MLCWTVYILAVVHTGMSAVADTQWFVSQDTYVTELGSMVSEKYNTLLNATAEFQPTLDTCAVSINETRIKCQTCLDNTGCNETELTFWEKIHPENFAKKMENITLGMADTFELVFAVYGPAAISSLETGLTSMMDSISSTLGSALRTAFEFMGITLKDLWEQITIFGKRRRRSIVAEAGVKRSTTSECTSRCPDCSGFVSNNLDTAIRAVCGDSVADTKATYDSALEQYKAFYEDWALYGNETLIAEAWADSSSNIVNTVKALKGGVYVTFDVTAENIQLNMWNMTGAYRALADFMYRQYA